MVIIGDVLVTKIIEKLIDVGFSYLADQYAKHTGMEVELRRLKDALPRIQAVIQAADGVWTFQPHIDNRHLQEWLQQFKDALYEADDALDELDYLRLQKQVEEEEEDTCSLDESLDEPPQKKVRRRLFSDLKEKITHIFKSDPVCERLRSAVKRLDEVAAHVGDFLALLTDVQQFQYQQHQSQLVRSRETGSLLTERKVVGRDREREELLQWLMKKPQPEADQDDDDDESNVSLYSVVGVGGMGKTTLAQLVYSHEDVQKSFDLKMWVCVSTTFDVRRITAAMLESATRTSPGLDNLAALQDALKDKLIQPSKKFLLVLDDVWDDGGCSDWDRLLAPLIRHGRKGSKILLTTRMEKVANEAARAMGNSPKQSLHLKPINHDEFFSLFERHAFAGARSGDCMQLRPIGRQIAKRLGGSPLAAKIIGALLNSNLDEAYWTSILHCKNISDQGQQGVGNIKSILMLSYHHLPPYLRPCFAFCGTFPQDCNIGKQRLVCQWMALGLIQHSPQNQGQTPEDIGCYYFDELLNRSFFEPNRHLGHSMHDLLHDVARSVSNGECFSIVNDDKSVEHIPHTIRHLFFCTNNLNTVMKVDRWQQLRSLELNIYIESHEVSELAKVLEKVFKSLNCVRVLNVIVNYINILPDAFGHLRHLRSLIIFNNIDVLPISVCKLYNLQALEFLVFDSIDLPKNMKNLISLRHLVAEEGNFYFVIASVRKLAYLQELNIYIKKERNYKIDELEGLIFIRKLHVKGLENVGCPEEASMAKLDKKEQLRVLSLEWSRDDDNEGNDLKMDEQQQMLDCLQPHSNLKELTIEGYRGVRPAKWMDFELVNNLQRIDLRNFSKLEHLPSFSKLPFLKYLYLRKMPLIKQLHCDCQQLEWLSLHYMEGLKELSHSDGNSGQWCPCLQKLFIEYSPELSVLPSLSLSLESMNLWDVGLTVLPELWLDSAGSSSSSSSSSLSFLEISGSRKLTSLDKGLLLQQHYLAALETLKISFCDMLVDFPKGGLQHLWGLKTLKIWHCPNLRLDLTAIDTAMNYENFLPSSLQSLFISCCAEVELASLLGGTHTALSSLSLEGMKSLRSSSVLEKLTSLHSLEISDCEELMSLKFINALPNLRTLSIRGSPKLVHAATTVVTTDLILAIDTLEIDDPMLLLTESFKNVTLLRELKIEDCNNLESISGQMEEWLLQRRTTLESLTLFQASSLKSLPDGLQTFSSLEYLELYNAVNLESLPQLPSSLKRIIIGGCSKTLKERCRKDEGADWPNIRHISHIEVNSFI